MIMVVVETVWGHDVQHIIQLCFDGILFYLMWTSPQRYVNKYELGFYYPQYTIISSNVFIYVCNSNFSKQMKHIYEQNKNHMFLFSCYSLIHRNTFSLFVQKDLENGLCWACCDLIITYHRLDILFAWNVFVAALIPHLPGTVSFI
jgi:hypothetical protein